MDFESSLESVRRSVENYVRFRLSDNPDWEDVVLPWLIYVSVSCGNGMPSRGGFLPLHATAARNITAAGKRIRRSP